MISGNFTDYLRDQLLDAVFGLEDYIPSSTLYIGLSTTTPDDDGANFTEPEGNGYERVSVTNDLTNWAGSVDGFKTNDQDFEFPEATGSWGTITHFAIFDGDEETDENMLVWGELTIAKEVESGDVPIFKEGDIDITMEGKDTT